MLVTGAGRGIGAAIAARAARPGTLVGINYLSRRDSAAAAAAAVEARGARALLLPADVSSPEAVDKMFDELEARAGRIDGLVCNAGLPYRYARLWELSPEDFETQWRVQCRGAFLCCRRAARLLARSPAGRIVFVLSQAAQGTPPAFMAHYVSAKYAVLGLARALETELRGKGVAVGCVFPPMTQTDFIKDFPRPIVETAREASPAGRLASPEEIAAEAQRLLDPESA